MARKEVHSEDLPPRLLPEMDMSDLDVDGRVADIIVADPERAAADYLGELAFMEEPVSIYLYRGRDEYAPDSHPFWVNGRMVEIPVETEVTVRRKYVEVMARSQPFKLRTTVEDRSSNDQVNVRNKWSRTASAEYPFTITRDANPRGAAWLERVKRES